MNKKNESCPQEVAMSLAITGRYVDEQVANGRALEDVLNEGGKNQSFWLNKNNLRDYSKSVSDSLAMADAACDWSNVRSPDQQAFTDTITTTVRY